MSLESLPEPVIYLTQDRPIHLSPAFDTVISAQQLTILGCGFHHSRWQNAGIQLREIMQESTPVIRETAALASFCEEAAKSAYVTVDTEFIRDKTFWPKLCLIQVAHETGAACIDPLAAGIDLAPLYALLADGAVLKVFHAARQDLEIFFLATGQVPSPLFDTQVAAMVCGFGDQVGYEALIQRTLSKQVDKSSRFTDWSQRPLTERQLAYALADVTFLRDAYAKIRAMLDQSGRDAWLAEEMAVLADPATYQLDPEEAWQRVKVKGGNPRMRAIVKELATWREIEAQTKDLPRSRVMKDDAILDVATHAPKTPGELEALRSIPRGFAASRQGQAVMQAVERGLALPKDQLPKGEPRGPIPGPEVGATSDLLKVLLKRCAEREGVAPRLIASMEDIERIAMDDHADVPALKGWRRSLFGEEALALKHGHIGLGLKKGRVEAFALQPGDPSG